MPSISRSSAMALSRFTQRQDPADNIQRIISLIINGLPLRILAEASTIGILSILVVLHLLAIGWRPLPISLGSGGRRSLLRLGLPARHLIPTQPCQRGPLIHSWRNGGMQTARAQVPRTWSPKDKFWPPFPVRLFIRLADAPWINKESFFLP